MSFVSLKCPACGADIQLDDSKEFGFCSYCGNKVIQDKVIVEHRGSVSIDVTNELNNLYMIARRAKSSKDFRNAQKYYEQIIVKDPTSWEANFYIVYYQPYNLGVSNINVTVNSLKNNFESTFQLIKNHVSSIEDQKNCVNEIVNSIISLSKSLNNEANKLQLISLNYYCGDSIERIFGAEFASYAIECWKYGIYCKGDRSQIRSYSKKIKKYDPTFRAPFSPVLLVIPAVWAFILFALFGMGENEMGIVYIVLSIIAIVVFIVIKVLKKKKT